MTDAAIASQVPPAPVAPLIWNDVELFDQRHEKSATALVMTKQLVEQESALAGLQADFLEVYGRVADADPDLFTRVWRDPTAYYWVRLTYELLGSILGEQPLARLARAHCSATDLEPQEALRRQLSGFKRFALGIAVLAQEDWEFGQPLEVRLPFAIPGTFLSLDGEGEVDVAGFRGGSLLLRHAGREFRLGLVRGERTPSGVVVCEAPRVDWKDCELMLQPHAFNDLPAMIRNDPVVTSGHAYQQGYVDVVRQGLRLMERYHPRAFTQFAEVMTVVAIKPLDVGGYVNVSYSDLPGAFVISATENAYEMADVLIHEFHHNRLFFIEENAPFFEDGENAVSDMRFYSPWRGDLRALMGILHGLYVFIPVREFWGNVARDETLDPTERDFARTWVARNTLELSIGAHQLDRHARFTQFGRELFEQLKERVRSLRDEMLADGLTFEQPALTAGDDGVFRPAFSETDGHRLSVREAVLRHMRGHAPQDQFDDIRSGVDFG